MKTPARAARAARTGPRRRRRAVRRSLLALVARRRAPAAALVVLLCASAGTLAAAALAARRRALVAARAAAARAARRWAGSGAASTSWTMMRRYCYCAQYRTKHSRTCCCRRSGRCPARRPAATASRWSRPPTRAACTSGRRRGVPLLCCGSSFRLPYQQYRSRRWVLSVPLDSWRHGSCTKRRMAHMSALGACLCCKVPV